MDQLLRNFRWSASHMTLPLTKETREEGKEEDRPDKHREGSKAFTQITETHTQRERRREMLACRPTREEERFNLLENDDPHPNIMDSQKRERFLDS